MKIHNLNIASLLLIILFTAGFGQAQQAQRPGPDKDDNKEHSLPCKLDKTAINAQGPTGKANLDHSDFPVTPDFTPALWNKLDNPATNLFNQAVPNQYFAYTFKFPAWTNSGKECCRCIDGATLTVKVKALQNGSWNSSSSGNDYIVVVSSLAPNHIVIKQPIWPQGATTGQVITLTIQVPCKYLTNGHLSFYVEDDTAVLSAQLSLSRCCLTDQGR